MYVRLGFAVAAHLDPEILLVDEVLAVGDAAFQRKCMNQIHELTGGAHDPVRQPRPRVGRAAVRPRVLIDRGAVAAEGPVAKVIAGYLSEVDPVRQGGVTRSRRTCRASGAGPPGSARRLLIPRRYSRPARCC